MKKTKILIFSLIASITFDASLFCMKDLLEEENKSEKKIENKKKKSSTPVTLEQIVSLIDIYGKQIEQWGERTDKVTAILESEECKKLLKLLEEKVSDEEYQNKILKLLKKEGTEVLSEVGTKIVKKNAGPIICMTGGISFFAIAGFLFSQGESFVDRKSIASYILWGGSAALGLLYCAIK